MYEEWNNEWNRNLTDTNTQTTGTVNHVLADDAEMTKKSKKKKEKTGFGMKVLGGAIFGLSAAVVFCGCVGVANYFWGPTTSNEVVVESEEDEEEDVEIAKTQTATTIAATTEGAMTVSQIAQNCMPSIVSITNKSVSEVRSMFGTREYESTSCGSGIIIGQNDTELLIASNNHVVENASALSVCFGDSEEAVYEAHTKGTDADNDLAILSVKLSDIDAEVLKTIKVATIGSSDSLEVGEQVIAIGNALGYGQSVTTGIVSAVDREVNIDDLATHLIQTDAAINPGNSGGALLNMKGELIGINSAKFASAEVEGMGYAIPIDTAEPILEDLMTRETRDKLEVADSGYLGISCQNVDAEVSEMYGIPEGVYVLSAEEGSAAQKAGIQKGDIITKFDGLSIDSIEDLQNTLLYYAAGEVVEVTIQRSNNGEYVEQNVTVILDKNEAEKQPANNGGQEPYNDGGGYYYDGDTMDPFYDFFNQFQGW